MRFLLKRFLFEYHCFLWRFKNVPVNSLTFFPLKVVSMPLSSKSAWAAMNSSTSQRWCYVTLGLGRKRHAASALFTRTPALGSLTPSEKSAPLSHRAGEGRAGLAGSCSWADLQPPLCCWTRVKPAWSLLKSHLPAEYRQVTSGKPRGAGNPPANCHISRAKKLGDIIPWLLFYPGSLGLWGEPLWIAGMLPSVLRFTGTRTVFADMPKPFAAVVINKHHF